jgi:hypothetical protein
MDRARFYSFWPELSDLALGKERSDHQSRIIAKL